MAEIIDIQELENGDRLETYSDGRTLRKDAEGKIVKTTLPPELASSMQKAGIEAKKRQSEDNIDNLLDELGLEGQSAELLARQFAKGGAAGVSAARTLFTMARKDGFGKPGDIVGQNKPTYGERCPTCNCVYFGEQQADITLQLVDALLAEKQRRDNLSRQLGDDEQVRRVSADATEIP